MRAKDRGTAASMSAGAAVLPALRQNRASGRVVPAERWRHGAHAFSFSARARLFFVIVFFAAIVSPAAARSGPAADIAPLIDQANAAYSDGAKLLPTSHDAAIAAFQKSAALYRRAIEIHHENGETPSGASFYNLGNACFLTGDTGQAVLNYRRAERLLPNNPDVKANLAAAREKLGAASRPRDNSGSLLRQLAAIEFVPAWIRFDVAVAMFALVWLLALARLRARRFFVPVWAIVAPAVVCILAAASFVPRELRLAESHDAVVVMPEITGRAGPDETTYEARPASPLKGGTEVQVLESRAEWRLVQLGDGTQTWLPARSIETVAIK